MSTHRVPGALPMSHGIPSEPLLPADMLALAGGRLKLFRDFTLRYRLATGALFTVNLG